MNHMRKAIPRRGSTVSAEYEPLNGGEEPIDFSPSAIQDDADDEGEEEVAFSWLEYAIFGFLGMAMLWSWNMFLASAPYFVIRFEGNDWIQRNFQSAIMTASTITSLAVMFILTNMQRSASYPFRINLALCVNTVVFAFLTVSTSTFLDAPPEQYFAFLLTMVAFTSLATAFLQNGVLSFAASFGRPEYMQGLVAGQAVAGVLPALAQVMSVLLFPPLEKTPGITQIQVLKSGQKSAFVYFLAAVVMSSTAIVSLIPLVRRYNQILENRAARQLSESVTSIEEAQRAVRKVISMSVLFRKLRWLACGVALIFITTMFFPVLTARVLSVRPDDSSNALFHPNAFIPLAFFFWNFGDLLGRMATLFPVTITKQPLLLLALAMLRIVQVPLYLLCNIDGRGAIVSSDFFYLFIVQVPFGFTNGWLCSRFMTLAPESVADGEREAAGSFMGLFLMIGLLIGSLLSFTASKS